MKRKISRTVRRVRHFFFHLRNRWIRLWGGWEKPDIYCVRERLHPEQD